MVATFRTMDAVDNLFYTIRFDTHVPCGSRARLRCGLSRRQRKGADPVQADSTW